MKVPIKKTVFIGSLLVFSLIGSIIFNHISSVHADTSSDQPASCPSGFIPVPGNSAYGTQGGFCVMKYEAEQGTNSTPISTGTTAPWTNVTQIKATNYSKTACSGCHLITENEWLTIANNVMNVASNWTGGTVGNGSLFSGYIDPNNYSSIAPTSSGSGTSTRTLTLSNGQVIWDLAGNAPEWTQGTIAANRSGASSTFGVSYEYNTLNQTNLFDFSPRLLPSYNDPTAASFTSSNGIGNIDILPYYSGITSQAAGFIRGGPWPSQSKGVFSLVVTAPALTCADCNHGVAYLGFRVAK